MKLRGRREHEPARGGSGHLIETNGVILHVRDQDTESTGPALVMLHGFMGSMAWFDALVPLFPNHHCIRCDMLGHGGSERPLTGYAPDQQAVHYEAALNSLGVTEAVVIGHSMGSNMAVALAERSAAVTAVVVIDEGPGQGFATNPAGQALLHARGLGPALHALSPAAVIRSGMKRAFAPKFRAPASFPDQSVRDYRALTHPAWTQSMKQRADWAQRQGLDERLGILGRPAMVVFGEQDQMFAVQDCLSAYRCVPEIRVEVLSGVGHTPMIEAPERLAALILDFVAHIEGDTRP